MIKNDDDYFDDENGLSLGIDASPAGNNLRREPKFSGFDEDDGDDYEEPDRDTDYASGYRADSVEEEEEEEFDDPLPEKEARDLFPEANTITRFASARSDEEESDSWLETEGLLEEEEDSQNWPLSLIAVGVVALLLLLAGGYGVMQQRAATQEELDRLRAALATSASPEEVSASRGALQELKSSYEKLAANAEALTLENLRLTDTVAGLEAQLGVQQTVLSKAMPAAKQVQPAVTDKVAISSPATAQPVVSEPVASRPAPATIKPAAAPPPTAQPPAAQPPATKLVPPTPAAVARPAVAQPSAATTSGPWFVNFGSYAARSMAESWAARLHPGAGKVIIAPNDKDGRTLYRVRVVGLASKSAADEVARNLQAQLQVSQLWVGRE
jgi:cell division protein FtsN